MATLYGVLGIGPSASLLEVRAAFKRRALALHPDKGGTKQGFQEALSAFETLSDSAARARYDRKQGIGSAGLPPPTKGKPAPAQASAPTPEAKRPRSDDSKAAPPPHQQETGCRTPGTQPAAPDEPAPRPRQRQGAWHCRAGEPPPPPPPELQGSHGEAEQQVQQRLRQQQYADQQHQGQQQQQQQQQPKKRQEQEETQKQEEQRQKEQLKQQQQQQPQGLEQLKPPSWHTRRHEPSRSGTGARQSQGSHHTGNEMLRIYTLLQSLPASKRKRVLLENFTQTQRLALESCIVALKPSGNPAVGVKREPAALALALVEAWDSESSSDVGSELGVPALADLPSSGSGASSEDDEDEGEEEREDGKEEREVDGAWPLSGSRGNCEAEELLALADLGISEDVGEVAELSHRHAPVEPRRQFGEAACDLGGDEAEGDDGDGACDGMEDVGAGDCGRGRSRVRGICNSQRNLYYALVTIEKLGVRSRKTVSLPDAVEYLVVLTALKQRVASLSDAGDTHFGERLRIAMQQVFEEHRATPDALGLRFRLHLSLAWFSSREIVFPEFKDADLAVFACSCLEEFRWPFGRVDIALDRWMERVHRQHLPLRQAYVAIMASTGEDAAKSEARFDAMAREAAPARERRMELWNRRAMRAEETASQAEAARQRLDMQRSEVRERAAMWHEERRQRRRAALERALERHERRRMAREEHRQRRRARREQKLEAKASRAMAREDRRCMVWRRGTCTAEDRIVRGICRLLARWDRRVAAVSARDERQSAARARAAARAARKAARHEETLGRQQRAAARRARWQWFKRPGLTMEELLAGPPPL